MLNRYEDYYKRAIDKQLGEAMTRLQPITQECAIKTQLARSNTSVITTQRLLTQSVGLTFLAAILSPLFLLVAAWRAVTYRQKHWLLTLFVGFYGATITISYDPLGLGADGVRHLLMVHSYMDMSVSHFFDDIISILTFKGESKVNDLFIHFAAYISGGILGEPWFFFVIVSLVYGYFMSGALLIVFRDWDKVRKPAVVIFFGLLIFFIFNLQGVQVVRTTTGLWVLVYGTLRYFCDRRLSSLFIAGSSVFFHFGYFVIAIPIIAVMLFGNRVSLYFVLFVASNITNVISPPSVMDLAPQPALVQKKIKEYHLEETVTITDNLANNEITNTRFWNIYVRSGVLKWVLASFVVLIMATGIYAHAFDHYQQTLYCLALTMLTFSNTAWFLSEVSGRSWNVGIVFALAAFLMARLSPLTSLRFPFRNNLYRWAIILLAVGFSPYLLWSISTLMDHFSIYMIGFPWFPIIFPELNVSIKQVGQIIVIDRFGL